MKVFSKYYPIGIQCLIGVVVALLYFKMINTDVLVGKQLKGLIFSFTVFPGMLLIIFGFFKIKIPKINRFICGISALIFLFGYFLFSFVSGFNNGPFTEISDYKICLSESVGHSLVEHFPSEIKNKKDVISFEYYRGFMQGGSLMHLNLKSSEAEIRELLSKYKVDIENSNKRIFDCRNGKKRNIDLDDNSLPLLYMRIGKHEVDDKYSFIVLGDDCGIGFSLQNKEIAYWAIQLK